MIGIYLLVTIFTQLSPQDFWLAPNNGPTELSVKFEKIPGIKVGTPVLAEGQLVGSVVKISSANSSADDNKEVKVTQVADNSVKSSQAYRLQVKIAPRHRALLRKGTIALIASPLSTARVQPESVVELLIPINSAPVLKEGEAIKGFSSYEEFWSAGIGKRNA